MERRRSGSDKGHDVRRAAETRVAETGHPDAPEVGDTARLLHELQVHQVELEMQNEELRRSQSDLEESRNRYWVLYDHAPFGYLTLERDGTIGQANLTAAELLGCDRGRLIGRSLTAFMDTADADRFLVRKQELMDRASKQSCDLQLRRLDGGVVDVRLDMVLDKDDGAVRLNTVMVDVSDLRRVEEGLRASEARFRQIAEHVEDLFYIRELDGRISYVSPAFERIWSRAPEWLTGRETGWLDTIEPDDKDRVAAAWARARRGASISEVYRIRRPGGTLSWVHSRSFAVMTVDGEVQRNVGVVRDITAVRELEDDLRQALKMEAVGTLAGGLAHNLRNVLQAIVSSIGLARMMGVDSTAGAHALDRAGAATNKGVKLINQLMTFARKQSGDVKLQPVRVDDQLREAVSLIKALVGATIQIELETSAPGSVVMADPVELEQIVLNLAANARDAMPGGGTIEIRTRASVLDEAKAAARGVSPGPHVIITFRDNGTGMDAATKARLFEPFFTTKEPGKGTGLGLSTVFALVRHFGGWIDVETEPGAGTTFSICLPSLVAPSSDGAAAHA